MKRIVVIILILLNIVVLLGQIWPDGAPPFARIVNIIFLISVLLFLVYIALNKKSHERF